MAKVKTAICVDKSLYNELENIRNKLNLKRSDLYARALSDFLEKIKNRSLLHDINAVFDSSCEENDDEYINAAKLKYSEIIEEEEW